MSFYQNARIIRAYTDMPLIPVNYQNGVRLRTFLKRRDVTPVKELLHFLEHRTLDPYLSGNVVADLIFDGQRHRYDSIAVVGVGTKDVIGSIIGTLPQHRGRSQLLQKPQEDYRGPDAALRSDPHTFVVEQHGCHLDGQLGDAHGLAINARYMLVPEPKSIRRAFLPYGDIELYLAEKVPGQ